MNNISAIGYNLQALFNQVSTLNAKIATLENQVLQAKVPSSSDIDPEIMYKLSNLETKYSDISAMVRNIDKEIVALKMNSSKPVPCPTDTPIPQDPSPIQEISSTLESSILEEVVASNDTPLDDLVLSVTPATTTTKVKGGRKKKT